MMEMVSAARVNELMEKMTAAQMKEVKTLLPANEATAIAVWQEEMDAYGLSVSRGTIGWYLNEDLSLYNLQMHTDYWPVKGNKSLIDRLTADGYKVEKRGRNEYDKGRYFVFTVFRDMIIKTRR